MRDPAEPVVLAWLDRQPSASVWTTSVTIFEIRLGLLMMPTGRRRTQLQQDFADSIREDLEGRIVPL
jgi:predicted nucleic acid-binding protein